MGESLAIGEPALIAPTRVNNHRDRTRIGVGEERTPSSTARGAGHSSTPATLSTHARWHARTRTRAQPHDARPAGPLAPTPNRGPRAPGIRLCSHGHTGQWLMARDGSAPPPARRQSQLLAIQANCFLSGRRKMQEKFLFFLVLSTHQRKTARPEQEFTRRGENRQGVSASEKTNQLMISKDKETFSSWSPKNSKDPRTFPEVLFTGKDDDVSSITNHQLIYRG
jgi:hypothetical protein